MSGSYVFYANVIVSVGVKRVAGLFMFGPKGNDNSSETSPYICMTTVIEPAVN